MARNNILRVIINNNLVANVMYESCAFSSVLNWVSSDRVTVDNIVNIIVATVLLIRLS